jgi:AGZA family xanthine/uracil permease-like MFS transporter
MEERQTNIKTEILAGITTFLAMSYIVFVNPEILCNSEMPKNSLVIGTCLATAIATILMGLVAKVPIAVAPGMGLNAFFAFSLVKGKGIPWETALGIVFLSGVFFFFLTIIGARERLINAIPTVVVESITVGIGLFIAFIGLQNMGIVVKQDDTLVTLGKMTPKVLIGLFGLILIIMLEIKKIRGSILIGIASSTILGLIFGQINIPAHAFNLDFSLSPIFMKLDIVGALKWSFIGVIFSLMFVDMFDTAGTIIGCSKEANLVNKDGTIKKLGVMLTLSSIATTIGSSLGTSPLTAYIESATGIKAGGRTGITAVIVGILFLLAIPFTSLISIVPGFAVASALIVVGLLMIQRIKDIDFQNIENGFPAFLTIILMPLTFSITTGMTFGFISYTLIKMLRGKFNEVDPVMWIIAGLSVVNLVV